MSTELKPEANVAGMFQSLSELAGQAKPFDDEGLFARNVNGQLVRVEKATAKELDTDVKLTIDGREVTVKKAVPTRDSQGNVIRDSSGAPIPRLTTIYDATSIAFVNHPGDPHPIPTLCHKEHLPPVGACRVCVVEAAEETRRGLRRKLVPSCVQQVSEGMIVHTVNSKADPEAAERVRAASSTVVELLVADHLPESQKDAPGNELAHVAAALGIKQSRFAPRTLERGQDNSSLMISVDHDQCILCGRCQRGCNWVKGNQVIGRRRRDMNRASHSILMIRWARARVSPAASALLAVPPVPWSSNRNLWQHRLRVFVKN